MLASSSIRIGGSKLSSTTTTSIIIPIITPTLGIESIAFGVLLSIIFGIYPAWKPSRKAPVEALRHELLSN